MLLIGTLLQMPSVHMTQKQITDHEPENTLIIGTDALIDYCYIYIYLSIIIIIIILIIINNNI